MIDRQLVPVQSAAPTRTTVPIHPPTAHGRSGRGVGGDRRRATGTPQRLGVMLLAALATTACGGEAGGSPSSPVAAATTGNATDVFTSSQNGLAGDQLDGAHEADDDLTIPLSIAEIIPPSPATSEVIWAATEELTQTCMAERGFDYDPRPSPGYQQAWLAQRQAQLMTVERADTVAYHPFPIAYSSEQSAADAALEQRAADPAYLAALGAQPGEAGELGCALLARQMLDADADLSSDDFNRLIGDAERQVFDAVATDADHAAAVARWSSCMAAGGHAYSTPDDAFADPRWATGEPSGVEHATARHDASCRDEAELNAALRQAQRRAVGEWIARNETVVHEFRRAEAALQAQAQAALANGHLDARRPGR